MAQDLIGYSGLVETALRGVVRQALDHVVAHGLPGEHHFYITFRTDHPAVSVSDALRARYPEEMTIVLQHQFWSLKVGDEGFEVTLSFSGKAEHLIVGYGAVKVFADPGVEFGLQFSVPGDKEADDDAEEVEDAAGVEPAPSSLPAQANGKSAAEDSDDAARPVPEGGAEVVTLDRFRKKK